jgi:branched-chain amino acid transport system ATP-binding protein
MSDNSQEAVPVLSVDSLSVGYSKTPIVRDASLQVSAGEIAVLIGPNGSGKSTLLKGIAGALTPMGGSVVIHGETRQDVTGNPPERMGSHGMAYVPQLANVFQSLTVVENLELGMYGVRRGVAEQIEYVYSVFPDLSTARRKTARTLSGGQREMLALGRALMGRPKVMLVDEPTAGLSPRYQDVVWEQLGRLRDQGVALFVVEQNTRQALDEADRAYVLVAGQIRREGPASELLGDEELVRMFIGQGLGTES